MFDVLLYEPEIPGNTGNVIRLCANTGARLHLIGPLGFTLETPHLRRAGLDYHDLANVTRHVDLGACLRALAPRRLVVVETGAGRLHTEAGFKPGDALLFGPESRGLPEDLPIPEDLPVVRVALPMRPANRSLNLSNAVAVTVYEAWRQNGFAGAVGVAGEHVTRTPP
jgi:tRNA (cytidine/uridine-2'-O-)-methyltransferase